MFKEIKTIDDVLPHVPEKVGIVRSGRAEHQVLDYVFVTDDTFNAPLALECRGLKFALDGRILARPFHKFFNLGERQAPEEIDWSKPHVVLDKLDGSMVHGCLLGDRLTLMTRMGESIQAEAALANADPGVRALCRDLLEAGVTPIFEFTSPEFRIVVAYPQTQLTLIGARETVTGRYLSHRKLAELAKRYGVALVRDFGVVGEVKRFVEEARALAGVEGYVVAFEDGHRLKLKADAYVLRHKALAGVAFEKNLLEWIVSDALDDVLALLAPEVAARVVDYRQQVITGLERQLAEVSAFVEAHLSSTRKDFALAAKRELDRRVMPVAFALLDGKDGRLALKGILAWASRSELKVDKVRDLFGMTWEGSDLVVEPG